MIAGMYVPGDSLHRYRALSSRSKTRVDGVPRPAVVSVNDQDEPYRKDAGLPMH